MDDTDLTPAEQTALNICNGNLTTAQAELFGNEERTFVLDVLFALMTFSDLSWPNAANRLRSLMAECFPTDVY